LYAVEKKFEKFFKSTSGSGLANLKSLSLLRGLLRRRLRRVDLWLQGSSGAQRRLAALDVLQTDAVHVVALRVHPRLVEEDVPQVPVAALAEDFGSVHRVRVVGFESDVTPPVLAVVRLLKSGPPRTSVVLAGSGVQRQAAAHAAEVA